MHRHTLSDTGDMASARSSRAPSFSSDKPSVASSITFQMPATVRPSPAYIAASVASQIVTDHCNAQLLEEDDARDELENAVFSEQALSLLNAFLDHLLFAFLSSARSPSLTAIRPAISDVLKPRLAREATEAADEELQGLLAGEDEEFPAKDGHVTDRWDVEKVWKRTRLRIMVYTRLGELEDEDEEKYVQQERGLSMDEDEDEEAGLVSWASAIFLTSVVEYVAEQTLLVSGSAAYARMSAKVKKLQQQQQAQDTEETTIERLVIEEPDVEKIALNSALGRLWRTWRKRVRAPLSPRSPGHAIRSVGSWSSLHRRKMSHDTMDGSMRGEQEPIPEHVPTETDIAANIPLPMGDNDVNEIEVPGLAKTYEMDDESAGTQTPVPHKQRPSSVIVLASPDTFRRRATKRPVSLPPPPASEFSVPSPSAQDISDLPETPFETPMEYATTRKSYMSSEQQPIVPETTPQPKPEVVQSSQEEDAEMVAFAASTGMGFRMSTIEPIETEALAKTDDEPEIPSAGDYESEPKIMQSKRMSVEKPGPPDVVRTFSTRSHTVQSALPSPVATANLSQQPEAQPYSDVNDATHDDEPPAIGVAHTSDVPIQTTPTPPDVAALGGYVEVHPRQTSISSISSRDISSPDTKPTVPERSVGRKDLHARELSGGTYAAAGASQLGNISSAPRQPSLSKTRGASLPSLQEVDGHTDVVEHGTTSEANPASQRKHLSTGRDVRAHTIERQVQHRPTEEARRSQYVADGGSPSSEKSAVQRVPSSSSKRSSSIHLKSNGRESESSQRSGVLSRLSQEDRERQFDSLVNGKETVKFTLTPQNVRDFEESQSPVHSKVETHRSTTSKSHITIHPRVNADKNNAFGTGHLPSRSASRTNGPIAAPTKSSPSRKVVGRPLAREPRIEQESMRDFADFIRSTGPLPGQEKPVQPFVSMAGNGPRPGNGSSSSLGRKASIGQNSTRGPDSSSAKPRMNMEPRSPAGLSSGNADLIDFIRQGPPHAPNGQPRIPRNVAPFRTTVDSDQFDQMLDGNNVESAYGSTASTLESKQSTQTINSRTGLIPEPKVVQPAYSNQPQKLSGNMASNNQEPIITRTRRRVRDPYAIDLSDDEDDEDTDQLTALPPSSQQPPPNNRQESLMDFLNATDPPSTSHPEPFMLSPGTIAAAQSRANTSTSTLSSTTTTGPRAAMSFTSVGSDAPRAYKPRIQARTPEPRAPSRTATSDLADFLKNSGPPEPVVPVRASVPAEEKKKSRRFWKRE